MVKMWAAVEVVAAPLDKATFPSPGISYVAPHLNNLYFLPLCRCWCLRTVPLTRLLGWLRQLLTTLGAVRHWVRQRSVLLVGVGVLSRGIVRHLDLW